MLAMSESNSDLASAGTVSSAMITVDQPVSSMSLEFHVKALIPAALLHKKAVRLPRRNIAR